MSRILAEVRQVLDGRATNRVTTTASPKVESSSGLDRRSPVVVPIKRPPARQESCFSLATSVGTITDSDLYLNDDESDYAASITYYTLEDI